MYFYSYRYSLLENLKKTIMKSCASFGVLKINDNPSLEQRFVEIIVVFVFTNFLFPMTLS